MPLGEPQGWAQARKQRLQQQYPIQFGNADAATVMGIDAMNVANGKPPSPFSQTAMTLAATAAQALQTKSANATSTQPTVGDAQP